MEGGSERSQQTFPESTMFVTLHFIFNPVSAQIICITTNVAEEICLGGGEPKLSGQWQSVCLAYVRLWVQNLAIKTNNYRLLGLEGTNGSSTEL